jgi:16S rRNA (cytosine967-C5)-methyltransferase
LLKDAWTLAIEALTEVKLHRLGERLALTKVAGQLDIKDSKAVGLAHRMAFETLRHQNVIDSLINKALTPRSISDIKPRMQSFLRLYTYRVLFEGAQFEEAASMAQTGRSILGWHEFGNIEEALGMILSGQLSDVFKGTNDEERVALQTYNPTWFVKYCYKLLGRNEALNFLQSVSKPPPTYLRVNTINGSEEECLRQLSQEGVLTMKEPSLKFTYRLLKTKKPLAQTRGFREGSFYAQDKASSLAVEVASPKPEDTVLDVCAAPGAKTTYMAQLMKNRGTVYSFDYSRRRMNAWKREIERTGVQNTAPIIVDAQKPLPIKVEADLILLDPPCTSTGAFGRTPSARWRLTKQSVFNMAKVQWNMLNNCAEKVKTGGHLVYSTCSISLEENEMLLERFLKWNLDFRPVETVPRLGLPGLRGQSLSQRLYPHLHCCNGFFVAKMVKKHD